MVVSLTRFIWLRESKILVHKEVVDLPLARRDIVEKLFLGIHGQGEDNTLALELLVSGKVEEEIVEEFVGGLGHRLLLYHGHQRVFGHSVYGIRHSHTVNSFRLLVCTCRSGKSDCQNDNHQHHQ